MQRAEAHSWDVVCRVVDHYGDAGVSLRLARALAATPGRRVRLLIDQPEVALRLIDPPPPDGLDDSGVRIVAWSEGIEPATVVVEAFGGGFPPGYREAMQKTRPVWVNLEYLSAEAWVEGCHGLPSKQADGLVRWFFFPGFSAETGGLLGPEAAPSSLPPAWDDWLRPDALRVSVFGYAQSRLADLIAAMADDDKPLRLLVPEGVALPAASDPGTAPGATLTLRPGLTLVRVPFVDQRCYDALLSACDLNLVRGEDSFVRAQWAGRPLLWQAYRQDEAAHLAKVAAFCDTSRMPQSLAALHRIYNDLDSREPLGPPWQRLRADWPAVVAWSAEWRKHLSGLPELADALVKFVAGKVHSRV